MNRVSYSCFVLKESAASCSGQLIGDGLFGLFGPFLFVIRVVTLYIFSLLRVVYSHLKKCSRFPSSSST